jgi:hypothetical protein
MAKTLLPFLWLLLLFFGCNNYGMLDKLENPDGGSDSAGSPSGPPPGPYRIFVTSGNFAGNILFAGNTGLVGADTACQSEGNGIATGRTWKAMLVDGTTRRACSTLDCSSSGIEENFNWVFKPNATYVRPGGTLIGNTNDRALLVFDLNNSIGTSDVQPWTGLKEDWTTDGSNNCNNWTIAASNVYGRVGQANLKVIQAIDLSTWQACNGGRPLYCVEQ